MNKKAMFRFCVLALAFLLIFSWSLGDDATQKVDHLFRRWAKIDSPGCSLAVIQEGKLIYQNGYGMANLELDVPITPQSVFYCGSVSKQFVAMCIALLIKESQLSLDDDIRKYLPELPDYGNSVKVHHLVYHTSGIRDYLTLEGIAGIPFGNYHEDDVLKLIAKQKGLNFNPGEEHLYSNSGYFLLAVIVKRASGKSLRDYARDRIFIPLGMANTHFHDDFTQLIKKRATGYFQKGKDTYKNFLSTFDLVGSGGLYSSVEDLFLWDQNFYHHQVGGKDTHQLMLTTGMLNNKESLEYAFAIEIQEYRGLKTISHGGALGGYRAGYLQFPDLKFSVIILANLDACNALSYCYRVADIYLEDLMTKPRIRQEPASKNASSSSSPSLTPSQLKEYQGEYYCEDLDTLYKLEIKRGKLIFSHNDASPGFLVLKDQDQFRLGNLALQFVRDSEGRITSFLLDAGRVRNLPFHKQN